MQCGIACLRMICEHYGRKYSSDDIARLCHATAQGVSLLGISRAAEQLGLHTVCGRLTMEGIEQAPLPCILHWNLMTPPAGNKTQQQTNRPKPELRSERKSSIIGPVPRGLILAAYIILAFALAVTALVYAVML